MICNKFQEDEKKKEYAFMILNDEIFEILKNEVYKNKYLIFNSYFWKMKVLTENTANILLNTIL